MRNPGEHPPLQRYPRRWGEPIRDLLRPTLVRRVILALLIAFGISWLVLLAVQFIAATDQVGHDREIRRFGEGLVTVLTPIEQTGEARAVASALEQQLNSSYRLNNIPTVLLIQLWDQRGTLVFASTASGDKVLAGTAGPIADAHFDGRRYRVFRGETPRWRIAVAQPSVPHSWLLAALISELTRDMLIAFPFVLMPIWIAVSHGLRPLRQLSRTIDGRGADDLSATGLTPSYEELRPLVRSLDGLLAQLRGKVEREHTFVQEAAHELRTPLAVISAQAHALVRAEQPQARRDAEQRLDLAIARASHLIEQLLELAQIDRAEPADSEMLDVAELVRQELATLAPGAMARGLDISLEAPDRLMHKLEAHAFRSILQNLVGNATRYVPEGARVVVGLNHVGTALQLEVADDGPGIPPAQRTRVFDRFYRGGGHDQTGSGLGLAIVKQACARLGGEVRLETGLDGRGCRFIVKLP